MKTIQTLLDTGHRVWFYLRDKETEKLFVKELTAMGATYLNGDLITEENCSPIMAVHADQKVAHVAIFIWNASFQGAQLSDKPIKVDYAKYIAGDEDWECKRSDFIRIS